MTNTSSLVFRAEGLKMITRGPMVTHISIRIGVLVKSLIAALTHSESIYIILPHQHPHNRLSNGARVVITTTTICGTSNRTVSFVRIFNFSQSDGGVYQCVFYDTPSQGGEVITTRPYKVDTGM